MKKSLFAFFLSFIAFIIMATPILAAIAYSGTITVNSNAVHTYLPLTVPMNVSAMISQGYINANATDLTLDNGVIYVPFMPVDDRLNFVAPSVALGTTDYTLRTANATLQTEFPIIPGSGGNVTVADNATLEGNDTFKFTIEGYFNTSTANVGKRWVYKEDAVEGNATATGTLQFNILGVSPTTVDFAVPSGYHTVEVNCDGVNIGIGFTSNTLNSTAAVSTIHTNADGYSYDHLAPRKKIIYANGRYWYFYNPGGYWGTGNYFRSSTDGLSWSGATQITNLSAQYDKMSVATEGTYVHLAASGGTGSYGVEYKRGLLNSNGTITWDATDEISAAGYISSGPAMALDTDGYPWYAKVYFPSGGGLRVGKSSTKDGTWTTDAAYSKPGPDISGYPYLIPLPNLHMLAAFTEYSGGTSRLAAYEWKGIVLGWGSLEYLTDANEIEGTDLVSLTADINGEVYIVWNQDGTQNIKGRIRHADGSLSAAIVLKTSTTTTTRPVIGYLSDMSKVYAFWIDSSNRINYSSCNIVTQIWDSVNTIWKTESYTTPPLEISVALKSRNGKLPITWVNDKATDEIRFSMLKVDTPSMETPLVAAMPDNANPWVLMDGDVNPYTTEFSYEVNDVEVLNFKPTRLIEDDTLPDTAGDAQDGTFNWGTNTAGVTSALTSFAPLNQAQASPGAPGTGSPFFTDIPAGIGNMYTEGDFTKVPGAAIINKVLDDSEVPYMLWWYLFIALSTSVIGFIVYGATRLKGGPGSVLLMVIVMVIVLAAWATLGAIGFSIVILFLVPALAFCVKQNQFSW